MLRLSLVLSSTESCLNFVWLVCALPKQLAGNQSLLLTVAQSSHQTLEQNEVVQVRLGASYFPFHLHKYEHTLKLKADEMGEALDLM